jgi:hypothetical protein
MITMNGPIEQVEAEAIPAAAAMVISALEAGTNDENRRKVRRAPYRVGAKLKLFSDQQPTPPWQLYVRDVNFRGLGFVTAHRLPLGYGGVIELPTPDGETLSVHCTLLRCRQAAPGWFEGCLYFNREQMAFDLRLVRNMDMV